MSRFMKALVVAFVLTTSAITHAEDYSDMWWNPNESGWGLIVIDHETDLFVVWCTYDANGDATWYVIPGGSFEYDRKLFTGNLYSTRAVAIDPFDGPYVQSTWVGIASIDFGVDSDTPPPPGFARFNLRRIGAPLGVVETRYVTRQAFGTGQGSWAAGGTDMWWNPGIEATGLATIRHGDDMFAVWLTYRQGGTATFFVVPSRLHTGFIHAEIAQHFTGTAFSTRARGANGAFDPAAVTATSQATASMTFYKHPSGRPEHMELFILGRPIYLSRLPFGRLSPTPPAVSTDSR